MRFYSCFIFIVFASFRGFTQKIDTSQFSRLSIYLETNIKPVASLSTKTILCYQGQLALEYNLFSRFQIGIFGQTLLYTGNYEIANIDNKIIELSSIEYNTCGITTGYKFQFNKIILNPKLDFSYNFFLAKSLDFPTDKNEFLDYRYLSINPKINLGYQITNGFTLGFNFGYNYQMTALKGKKLEEFNSNTIQGGIFAEIPIK